MTSQDILSYIGFGPPPFETEEFDTAHVKEYPQYKVAWVRIDGRPDTTLAEIIVASKLVASNAQLHRLARGGGLKVLLAPSARPWPLWEPIGTYAAGAVGPYRIKKGQRTLDIVV